MKTVSILDVLELETVPARPLATPPAMLDEKDKKMVCLLVSMGEPTEAVARKLALTRAQVEMVISSDEGIETLIRFQTAAFPDPMARLRRITHLAIDAQLKILVRSENTAALVKVAQDVLDRTTGKPTQVVENRNLNVNITDMASADRALQSANERLARLEETQKKLMAAKRLR